MRTPVGGAGGPGGSMTGPEDPRGGMSAAEKAAIDPAAFVAKSQDGPPSEPTQNYFVDKAKRAGRSLAQVPGQFVESVGQMADATGRALAVIGADELNALRDSPTDARLAAFNEALRTPTPGTALIRDTGREMAQNARDLYKGNYAPDPARDAELGSDVAGATGSLAAALITPGGLITKTATGALFNSLGQSDEARRKMLERGATEKQADDEGLRQFVLNLPAGGLEAIPWGNAIKRFGGGKIADAVSQKYGKTALRRISTAVFGQAATEAGEEALQNLWGNAAAKLTYDPTRGWTEGTGRAALVGGVMGGGFGGTLQGTAEIASALDARGQRLRDQMPAAPVPAAQADLDEALARQAPPVPEAPPPPAPVVPPAQADLNAALALQARAAAAPETPLAPAQVAPPEPAAAPVVNAPGSPASRPPGATPVTSDKGLLYDAQVESDSKMQPGQQMRAVISTPESKSHAIELFQTLQDGDQIETADGMVLTVQKSTGKKSGRTSVLLTVNNMPVDGHAKTPIDNQGKAVAGETRLNVDGNYRAILERGKIIRKQSPGPPAAPAPFDPVAFIAAPEPAALVAPVADAPAAPVAPTFYRPLAVSEMMSPDFRYEILNPVPVVPAGHSIVKSEIIERKIKGEHPLWRISAVRNAAGELYAMIERAVDEYGTTARAETRFSPISSDDLDSKRALASVNTAARRIWEQAKTPPAEAPPAAPKAKAPPAAAPVATAPAPVAPAPEAPAAAPAADYEDLLKVEVPDSAASEAATAARTAQMKALNEESAQARAALKEIEAVVLKRTGPMYQRGRVKASATNAQRKIHQDALKRVAQIEEQASRLQMAGRNDAYVAKTAELARRINDPKNPLVRRLALRLELYERQNPGPVGPEGDRLLAAFERAAEAEVRARVPDATPEEVRKLSIGLQRAAGDVGRDLDSAWRLAPDLNVHTLRSSELDAALNKADFNRWREQATELNQEVNRYTDTFKGSLDKYQKRPTEPLTRAELAAVLKRAGAERERIEGERLAVERMQQAKAEAAAKRQGITKIVTAEGITIAPTPPVERRVSKLADRPQLKAQREFLEKALREAAAVAPDEGSMSPEYQADYEAIQEHLANWRGAKDLVKAEAGIKAIAAKYLDVPPAQIKGGDQTARLADAVLFNLQGRVGDDVPAVLVVEVPGDGTFRVQNWKQSILNLAETVRKEFGRGLAAPAVSSPPVRGRSLPALGKVGTPAEINKILAEHVHETKGHIMGQILQDGPWTLAGKGTYMFFVQGGKGRNRDELGDKFPPVRAMLAREAPELTLTDAKGKARAQLGDALYKLPLDVTTQLKVVNSAIAAIQADGKKDQIQLHVSGESLGISYVSVVDSTAYKSDGVLDGAPSVATIDAYIWRDVLETFRRFGIEDIELAIPAAPKDPEKSGTLSLRGGDTVAALVKQRIAKQAEAAPSFEDPAAPAPAPAEAPAPAPAPAAAPAKAKRGSRGANASPGFAAAPPMGAPGGPPKNQPAAPADDPAFSELPIELPEAVQFFKLLTGGQYAHIRERIRALNGQAAGVFRYREGDLTSGEIELRADLFNLLSLAEKQDLLRQAVAWANAMRQGDKTLDEKELIRAKFEELVRAAEKASVAAGPVRALATFWHEVGHFLDFYPQATTKRGNILGRLASLHHYLKNFLAKSPGLDAAPPNAAERAAFRRQAERELTESVSSIVETIRREEPVYREIPITADTITGIVKNLARDEFPEFYDWFAKLDRVNKAGVLRAAMKGIVDERAAKFGRREATGEVKVVEETVTRVTGTPPSPENIRARYEELLRAELESRGLINEKDIRKELEGAIAWWRGTKTVPEYFKPSVELWADTMSIFFNNPAALAQRAPKFYEAFMRWMAVKPGIREEYDKIQHAIKSGQIYRDRVTNLREMFVRDDAAGALTDEFATRTSFKQDVDAARLLFDRQFGPIERRIGRNPTDIQGRRALAALGNFRYRATGWEAFAHALRNEVEVPLAAAGLSHLDMAEYLFHRRITDGIYRNLAAPLGWNPKNSGERLAEMERDLGPARWQSLVGAQVALRGIYEQRVVKLLHESGVMSPELGAAVDKEIFYAPFNKARVYEGGSLDVIAELIKVHHGDEAAGQIYGSVGNIGEIRSPYVQLMHRALGLISMAHRQLALKRVADWLRVHEPLSIAEAPMKWNGKRLEPVRVENSRVSTLYLLNGGTVNAVYVPRVIGEMFASGGPMEMRMIAISHTLLSPPKAMLTELNPGFWPVAFAKDVWSATALLPGGSRVMAELPRAYLAAYHTFYGRPDPLAQQVLDRMMVISRADSRGEHLGHADEMTRILLRLGKSPAQWNAEVGRIEQVLRVLWRGWAQQGQIFERTVKIASMRSLDRAFPDMPEARKQELVRERGGSPDFLSKGRWARVVELGLGLMFYNAWKEGARSTYRAMAENPRGFWSKFAATAGAAGAVMWALEAGLVGDDEEELRDMLRSIPERDKLRGLVLPLGWNDKATFKVLYVVLPFPESIRWAHALQRKALQTSSGNSARAEGLGSVVNYQGQDLPGQNPWITSVSEIYDYYVKGINPYDEFTGRGALDQTRVDAGQAGGELAKRTISNVTGGIAYRHRTERPGEQTTGMEEFLKLPVVSNLLGRWVRVSNRGLDELYRQSTEGDVREQASLRLVGEEMISRTMKGEPWAKEHLALVGSSDYLANYINDAGPRLMMQADSPFLRAMTQAKTNAEKLSIWKVENERNQAKVKRLDRAIATPTP
jgi:hypothetical protein